MKKPNKYLSAPKPISSDTELLLYRIIDQAFYCFCRVCDKHFGELLPMEGRNEKMVVLWVKEMNTVKPEEVLEWEESGGNYIREALRRNHNDRP